MSSEQSADHHVLSEIDDVLETADVNLDEAEKYRAGSEYGDALDAYDAAKENYENALELARRTNIVNASELEIEEKLEKIRQGSQEIRRQRIEKEMESIKSQIEGVEVLVERFGDDGVPLEAKESLEELESRFEPLLDSAMNHGFEELENQITELDRHRRDILGELASRGVSDLDSEKSSPNGNARAREVLIESSREAGYGGTVRHGLLTVFFLPIIVLYPYIKFRNNEDSLDDWFKVSPLAATPGLSPSSLLPSFLYATLFVSGIFVISTSLVDAERIALTPYLLENLDFEIIGRNVVAVLYSGVLGVGVFTGLASVLFLRNRGMEREFLGRFARSLPAVAVYPVLFVLFYGFAIGSMSSEMFVSLLAMPEFSVIPMVTVLFGSLSGNGYIIKSNFIKAELKSRGSDAIESQSFVHSDLKAGTTVDDINEEEIIDRFVSKTWDAPANLSEDIEIVVTRDLITFRDITKDLEVSSRTRTKTSPGTSASTPAPYKGKEAHAPDGFKSKSVRRYVSGSKNTTDCPRCYGEGKVDCRKCGASGRTTCSRCGGSGRDSCNSCGGSGKDREGNICHRCGGGGSVTCTTCGGNGKERCSRCAGSGRHSCKKCRGSGKVTKYKVVTLTYSPKRNVSYRANSIPTALLEDADGEKINEERTENPERNIIRRKEVTEKIPVTSIIYRYLGDDWEIFEIEDDVKADTYPRDFQKQFAVVCGLSVFAIAIIISTISYQLIF